MRSERVINKILKFMKKGALSQAALICAAALGVSTVFSAFSVIPAYPASSNEQINASKKKISDNKKKIDQLKNDSYKVDAKIDELNKLKSDAAAYITKLDGELAGVESQITGLESQITDVEEQIDTTTQELAAAEEEEARQYSSMKTRIKFMYEHSNDNLIDVLLGSKSFSEMINKTEYISNVTEYDREKLDEYVVHHEAVAAKKEELQSEKDVLEQSRTELENKKSSIKTLQADKEKEVDNFNSKISAAEGELSDMQSEMSGLQAAIKAEESNIASIEAEIKRQEEAARKKAEAEGKPLPQLSVGDISFTWPCPSSSRVTSGFGARSSPTEGASTNHKGIDIGASSGSSVVAAADGTVVLATYSASAGNYVMISHGGGVYTVYMHMSSIAVSKGQTVSKGSTIGAVGSTGYSTGPHLHFGLRINGSYVDPMSYVG